ncbi:dr1-associated corepressor [Stylonychia lemnae]|uniref:Dr1-associated corepressor n=1 Tax=Stylonychia lemnae TaxID=5949 RepID=A0A078AA55_STYLE|nr:dr1-associated corepressor [Stylonychia lemnae]|eukprot:CDW79069.1 dr1-associated corepressor [Stylonychia lemnae]
MQTNKEIGKIQSTTPIFIAKALEFFIEDITKLSVECTQKCKDNKITPSHIKEVIESNEKFAFLKETVSKITELDKSKKEVTPSSSSATGGAKRKQKENAKKQGDAVHVVEMIKPSVSADQALTIANKKTKPSLQKIVDVEIESGKKRRAPAPKRAAKQTKKSKAISDEDDSSSLDDDDDYIEETKRN